VTISAISPCFHFPGVCLKPLSHLSAQTDTVDEPEVLFNSKFPRAGGCLDRAGLGIATEPVISLGRRVGPEIVQALKGPVGRHIGRKDVHPIGEVGRALHNVTIPRYAGEVQRGRASVAREAETLCLTADGAGADDEVDGHNVCAAKTIGDEAEELVVHGVRVPIRQVTGAVDQSDAVGADAGSLQRDWVAVGVVYVGQQVGDGDVQGDDAPVAEITDCDSGRRMIGNELI